MDESNKENVVYIYKEILFNQEKEGNPDICDNIYRLWVLYAKLTKSDRERQNLNDLTYMLNLKKLNS